MAQIIVFSPPPTFMSTLLKKTARSSCAPSAVEAVLVNLVIFLCQKELIYLWVVDTGAFLLAQIILLIIALHFPELSSIGSDLSSLTPWPFSISDKDGDLHFKNSGKEKTENDPWVNSRSCSVTNNMFLHYWTAMMNTLITLCIFTKKTIMTNANTHIFIVFFMLNKSKICCWFWNAYFFLN